VLESHAGLDQEAVLHFEVDFAHNVQPVAQEEVIIFVDAATKTVLDGEERPVSEPAFDGFEGTLELLTSLRHAAREHGFCGFLAVRTGHTLRVVVWWEELDGAKSSTPGKVKIEIEDGRSPRTE
jgi:hypothetical protein